MSRFKVKVVERFYDIKTGELYQVGDIVELDDESRVRNMHKMNLAELLEVHPPKSVKKHGNTIMIYQTLLYRIGGIETADYNLARAFHDRKITFVFKEADFEQALRIGQYCSVKIDDPNEQYETDVLIVENYDAYPFIKERVEAKKKYQHIHADWYNMKKLDCWSTFEWQPDEDIDKVISVSDTAAQGLLKAMSKPIESEVVPNIVCDYSGSEFKTFLTLSRFTAEKGGEAVIKMVEAFDRAQKPYLWFITALETDFGIYQALKDNPSVIFIPPHVNNPLLIKNMDYLVQLSQNESFCYSAHEAMQSGVPVIATRIPEMEKLIQPGKNGYLVNYDLSDLDVEAIFTKKPVFEPVQYKVDPKWEKVLKGKL